MQQRREEILAKKAKLAELKRQRELRANQANAGRASFSSQNEVRPRRMVLCSDLMLIDNRSLYPLHPAEPTTGKRSSPSSIV